MAENGTETIPKIEDGEPEQVSAPDAEVPEQATEMKQEENMDQPESEQVKDGETAETVDQEAEVVRDPIVDEEEMKKLFVGGVTTDSTDDELKAFFEEMSGGSVIDNVIIRKDSDKKSHFGFVTFETSELVDEVLLKRDILKFKDRSLDVNRAVPKNNTTAGAHEKTKKLFIANLPKFNCSEDDLMKYFECRHPIKKYGTIENIQLIKKKDEHGNKLEENKGFGFIMVSSEDMADKMAIQHATFEFGGRKIELKKSVPTGEGGGKRRGGGRGGGGHQMYGQGGYGPNYAYGGYGGEWGGYGQGYPPQGYGYGDYNYGYGGGYAQPGGGRGGRGGAGGRYRPY